MGGEPHLVMGRFAAPFGVRGWLRVTPWSEDPASLLAHRVWAVRKSASDAWRSVDVVEAKAQLPGLIAKLRGVDSREDAAALRGYEIGLARTAVSAPGPGEVYWADLVGLDVVNRQGVSLGRVTDVTGYGAHPVLHVTSAEPTARLIPYVPAYVERIDLAGRRIDVDWQPDF
ncbi:MAG TPA: ribosome maturation factor RimM [Casimicrobiaceae bacterium]|nr:ribosome maturation factor RimM [Casimicrobiaceae bacterium]